MVATTGNVGLASARTRPRTVEKRPIGASLACHSAGPAHALPGASTHAGRDSMRKTLLVLCGIALASLPAIPARATASFSPHLASLSVGGGVSDFTRSNINRNASVSGAYDARIMIGTRLPIAFEGGYLGTS